MYSLLGFLNGVLLASMMSINGRLTSALGPLVATVVIHVIGGAAALVPFLLTRPHGRIWGHRPIWVYLGGVVGVGTTIFQCAAILTLSLTSVVALGLLGQVVSSLAIDTWGLFGAERRRPSATVLVSLAFAAVGIGIMLSGGVSAGLAVVCALCSGVCIVTSRSTNARLATFADGTTSTLLNYVTALPVALVVAVMSTSPSALPGIVEAGSTLPVWAFAGGVLSVGVIAAYNVVVPRLSAVSLTLLVFAGQVICGFVVDVVARGGSLDASVVGGLVVTAGIVVSRLADLILASSKKAKL